MRAWVLASCGLLTWLGLVATAEAQATALCTLPTPPLGATDAVLRVGVAATSTPPSGWWRLRALLPARLTVSRSEGVTLGLGEVLGTTGTGSERTSAASSAGYAVRLVWDLRPLLAPPPSPMVRAPIDGLERRERLGGRIVGLYARYRGLVEQAAAVDASDPICSALRAEAEALRALLDGLSPSRRRPSEQRARRPATAPPPRRALPS